MNSEDAAAIVQSLEIAAEHSGDLTPAVYARLFAQQPQMRALFVLDTNDAVKGEMLARVFDAILDFVGERRYGHRLILSEAVNHEGFNIPRDMFATFFTVVADTVREACGSQWTDAMADAWVRLNADLIAYVRAP